MAFGTVADLVGRVLAGRYRLLAPIGAGSGGRVYIAEDVRLRRRVAVKVLHDGLADDAVFLRRFRAEARAAASLNHPNVLAVYDWGENDGVAFMVNELLAGGSLRAMLDRGNRLTPAQAVALGRQVTSALQYAHARGLIHRDIKPANLLFDEHGFAHVADFGLAKVLAEASWTEPAAGGVIGTARYAAPEQASTTPLDGRADLYALAVVLIEAVTGNVPNLADTPVGTLAARSAAPLEVPPELGPLAPVVARAGMPVPAQRFRDAAAMGDALAEAMLQLPAPTPLSLPGIDAPHVDAEPTRLRASTTLFDQDATDKPQIVVEPDRRPVVVPSRRATRPPGSYSRVPFVVGLAVVLALVAGAAALLAVAGGGPPPESIPNFIGLSEEQAAAKAGQTGVLLRIERRDTDDPKGTIIDQRPGAGEFVAKGDQVRLIVSRGPPPVGVPDVTGVPKGDASKRLYDAGLTPIDGDTVYDENVAAGNVVRTDPAADAQAPRDSAVKLIVSKGPAPVGVPNVTGRAADDAIAQLRAKGFSVQVSHDYSDTVGEGDVIGTDPDAGVLAPRGSTVTVIVSNGPEPVTVPNVVGLTVEEATARLQEIGLNVEVHGYAPGKKVRAQDPTPRTTLLRGDTVALFL